MARMSRYDQSGFHASDEGPDYHADDPDEDGPLTQLMNRIHKNAVDHGFWPEEGRNFGEVIALIHSEASEALEEHRSSKPSFYFNDDKHDPLGPKKPEGTAVELIDVIVRCLDALQHPDVACYDPDYVIAVKLAFNESRPHKHGRKY